MRRFPFAALVVALALVALGARPAAAQAASAARPHGIYASLGAAAGVHRTSCPVCDIGGIVGSTGTLTVGAALSPNLVLAGEAGAGYFHKRYVEDGYLQAGPALIYYPSTRGVWLRTGVDFTVLVLGEDDGGAVPGAAVSVGVGYDLPLGRALALSPSLTVRYAKGQDVHTAALLGGLALTLP